MTQNEHVYANFCRLEVDDDVISGRNIKTSQGSCWYILKVLALVLSEMFQKDQFVTVKSVTAAVALTRFAANRK